MAEIPNHVRKIVSQYLDSLKEQGFEIQEAILFGSHARGQADEWSDIDIALVSEEFEGIRFLDKNKIRKITLSVSTDLEVLPFNPRDFTARDPLVKEILDTGIRVL